MALVARRTTVVILVVNNVSPVMKKVDNCPATLTSLTRMVDMVTVPGTFRLEKNALLTERF